MTEEPATFLPIWILLSAAFGFLAGEVVGDSVRHRKCLEQANQDLKDELDKASGCEESIRHLLEQQQDAISDIHGYLLPGSKGSEKPPS